MPRADRLLGADATAERRDLLRRYIIACVRSSALSWSDLMSSSVYDKLLRVISRDGKAVMVDLVRSGSGGLLGVAGAALGELAKDVAGVRRQK